MGGETSVRNQNGFMSGMMAGLALGSLLVIALTPQVRSTVMEGMGQMGTRMTGGMGRMWRRGSDMMSEMMPGDAD